MSKSLRRREGRPGVDDKGLEPQAARELDERNGNVNRPHDDHLGWRHENFEKDIHVVSIDLKGLAARGA